MKLTQESISRIEAFIEDYLTLGSKTAAEKYGASPHTMRTAIFALRFAGAEFPRSEMGPKKKFERIPVAEAEAFRAWKSEQERASQ